MTRVPLDQLPEDEIERLYHAGLVSDDEIERIAYARISPQELAIIDAFAYGLAKFLHTPLDQLAAEAASYRAVRELPPGVHAATYNKVTQDAARGNLLESHGNAPPRAYPATEENDHMSAYPYVGADGQSYPEVAARAVQNAQQQSPSPVYGYLRTGAQQKIYLFQAIQDAHGWITTLIHGQAQPYDYAAVFAATDLTRPVPGLESFGHTFVSGCPQVGNVLPFLLGLPAGALGGYFLRRWQEDHPGQTVPGLPPGMLPAPKIPGAPPKASGDWIGGPWLDIDEPAYAIGGPWLDVDEPAYAVGGPWLDVEEPAYTIGGPWLDVEEPAYTIGGPWVDVVGAQIDDRSRMRAWPQTKALIHSAIKEVVDLDALLRDPGTLQMTNWHPGEAYVWSLDPPGGTNVEPFASPAEALDYMRQRIQTPHAALALFDRRSSHWPNPTNWTKSNDPVYEPVIAAQAARAAPTRMAGSYVGAVPWQTTIGTALDDVRARSQSIANKRAGSVVGVIHTVKDGLWHALAFRNADDADDWLGTATQDPAAYTYAAYYDKEDFQWPHPVNEKIGGSRVGTKRGPATVSGRGSWRAA